MSYHPGILIPIFCSLISNISAPEFRLPTTVMGIVGALGKMNLTSWNLLRLRQFSAKSTHPAPLSPRPCAMITVAVCFLMAGMMSGVGGGMIVMYGI